MGTQDDRFAAFVEALADGMDEHLSPAELAERLHLSRSHLDRVVAAVGGESPIRLRRRVLLERAAWRLTVGDGTILDAAIEAGYSSHEAFSRAFAQAYGSSPSVWRTEPTQLRLPGPSGVHFAPPGGLFLPGPRQPEGATAMFTALVDRHIQSIGRLIAAARELPDEQLDRPIEFSVELIDDLPTIRRLLSRLVGQLDMWNQAIRMGDYDFGIEAHESLPDLEARLARVGPAFLAHVRQADEYGSGDDTFVDALCEPPITMTYLGLINHVLTYGGHRKTLVAGALTSAGCAGFDALASSDHG
ncbi:helix-turn-helix domain-containing protein [Microlunatus sp. GCM10028923]|uniref:helix-turn-helix domain-containing protein n=1 Tax=Microlunatus sp. GCM10028923 TaxID=3273400 RepID=UPI003619B6E6